jgi:hypothetical protein
MYGIYANIGGIWIVNVTIYGIHGSYGWCYYQKWIFHNISKSRLFFNYKTWDVLWVLRSKVKLSLRMPPGNLRWGVNFSFWWWENMLEMIFLHDDFPLPGYITIGWDAWVILKSQYRWGGTHVPNFCMISSINDFRARSWFIFLQTALTEMNTYPRTSKLTRSTSPFG